jgi:hypothetical protein
MFKTLLVSSALAAILTGCGTFNAYRLPMDAAAAPSTYGPLISVAQNRGLEAFEGPNGVVVKVDPITQLWFQPQPNTHAYNMIVHLDDEQVAPGELAEKVRAAKALGDALWNEAMAARRATGTVTLSF